MHTWQLADACPSTQYAFNLFSHTTKIGDNGYNEEEMKMVKETRKIWGVRAGISGCCVANPPALLFTRLSARGAASRVRVCAPLLLRAMICFTHQLQT
jgi:hypothetical protein